MMTRSTLLFVVLSLLLAPLGGCLGGPGGEGGDVGRVGMALTMPMADPGEIRGLGLFALARVSPEFVCADYYAGTADPISQFPESLVAVDFADIPAGGAEAPVTLRGITQGERSIIVEAYDSGGSRIYLGCAQEYIEAGSDTEVEIRMQEDPLAP